VFVPTPRPSDPDTVVLIAFRDRNDPHFKKADEQVIEIGLSQDALAPSVTLMEFDLELKSDRGRRVEGRYPLDGGRADSRSSP
jgi:hypothetical protein